MRSRLTPLAARVFGAAILCGAANSKAADDDGFKPIFNGKNLDGWDGDPRFWSVADGMIEACAAYGIALVGGDLTAGERLVISVAITGTCDDRAAVLRSGASDGDVIWVTGPLGSSAAGLRLLQGVTMPPPARPPAAQPPASQPAANQLPAAQPAVGGEPRRVSLTEAQSRLVDAYRRPVARIADGMTAAAAGATAMLDVSEESTLA